MLNRLCANCGEGFAPIEAIFYTVFHPTEGTKVSHQVPLGSIVAPPWGSEFEASQEPLFDFDVVKNYIIPKGPLCNRLITLKVDQYSLVGYPVQITAPHYARNSFSFNFCFVFNYGANTIPFESAIRRLGRMFKNLEEQYHILSKKEDMVFFKNFQSSSTANAVLPDNIADSASLDDHLAARASSIDSNFTPSIASFSQLAIDLDNNINSSTPIGVSTKNGNVMTLESIESLIQQIYQDLNNYSECLIPVDSGNSVDIKLLPLLPPPPRLNPEDVPISTVQLNTMVDVNWDPTMLKILPYIDGINSIKRISLLADADYWVVKSCIQHLMYYKCITITDIFQFSNIYAPTADIDLFLKDPNMATDCQAYVVSASQFDDIPFDTCNNPLGNNSSAKTSTDNISGTSRNRNSSTASLRSGKRTVVLPSKAKLFYLYRSLHQGQTVRNWFKEHRDELEYIDVRRLLTFGVLRGLIYRVESYPLVDSLLLKDSNQASMFGTLADRLTPTREPTLRTLMRRRNSANVTDEQRLQISELSRLLESSKSFDAICTEMSLDRKSVETLLRTMGPFNVVNS